MTVWIVLAALVAVILFIGFAYDPTYEPDETLRKIDRHLDQMHGRPDRYGRDDRR